MTVHGVVRRQGVNAESLIAEFDKVGKEHKMMTADMFNDDHTYKEKLNQVNNGMTLTFGTFLCTLIFAHVSTGFQD
jgi:hypothetical protein